MLTGVRSNRRFAGTAWVAFAARRLVRLALLLAGVAVGGFLLLSASPLDPVEGYVRAETALVGPEQRELIAERWGLNQPGPQRLQRWAANALRGDWGFSATYNTSVLEVITTRWSASISLLGISWILSGLGGFLLGVWAGVKEGGWIDRVIRAVSWVTASSPAFWVALIMLTVFAVELNWAPVCCAAPIGMDPNEASLAQRLHHLILPALSVSLVGIAPVALHTRQAVVETLNSDHVLFAQTLGETRRTLLTHHILRHAAVPAAMLQFASLSELFGGSVLAEQVFGYPGLGQATVRSAVGGDLPLLLGISVFAAFFVFLGNLIGDIALSVIDPRVSLDPKGTR